MSEIDFGYNNCYSAFRWFYSLWSIFYLVNMRFYTGSSICEKVAISKMEITTLHGAIEGKTQTSESDFYNLDAIISVGYRANSKKATQFRIWATKVLKEYMQKGFVLGVLIGTVRSVAEARTQHIPLLLFKTGELHEQSN